MLQTELFWNYSPADLFEEPYKAALPHGSFLADGGKASLFLSSSIDPVPDAILTELREQVSTMLSVRSIAAHKNINLNGPHIRQHLPDGQKSVQIITCGVAAICEASDVVDVVIISGGKVTHDSKLERIKRDDAFLADIASKVPRSTLLAGMVQSYCNGIKDPRNELFHLFEILEAARVSIGARANHKWKNLATLANSPELAEGRHRGKKLGGQRPATERELSDARLDARDILRTVANETP
jgi:hypothetical protein